MAILEVRDLTKSFGKTPVIKGVSFDMAEGEILGILGPNGAGKTTTLQMILGILTPTSGTINIFGQPMPQDKTTIMEHVNFSSTYTDLPWRLSVRENLVWTSWLYNIANRKKRLEKIKTIFRLDKLWNQSTASLSAGQRTRLNLARSMVNFPRLLLLDEPTSSKFARDQKFGQTRNLGQTAPPKCSKRRRVYHDYHQRKIATTFPLRSDEKQYYLQRNLDRQT